MSFEKEIYEVDAIWNTSWFSEADQIRFNRIVSLIEFLQPKSLVDVGCGNGIFLNQLQEHPTLKFENLLGIERSEAAIKFVKTKSILASIHELPIEDNAFEIATCFEVLEHLPQEVYNKSLNELSRIASRYIFITVPYNQNLKKSLIECPYCKTKFNAQYHIHSFNQERMEGLFLEQGFRTKEVGFIEVEVPAFSKLINFILTNSKKAYYPKHTICPMCGYNRNEKIDSFSNSKNTNEFSFKSKIKGIWPQTKRKRWIYGIYEKR